MASRCGGEGRGRRAGIAWAGRHARRRIPGGVDVVWHALPDPRARGAVCGREWMCAVGSGGEGLGRRWGRTLRETVGKAGGMMKLQWTRAVCTYRVVKILIE
jgi:hypothetical protein